MVTVNSQVKNTTKNSQSEKTKQRKAIEKVNEVGIRTASRELNIPRKNLRRESKQKDHFEEHGSDFR